MESTQRTIGETVFDKSTGQTGTVVSTEPQWVTVDFAGRAFPVRMHWSYARNFLQSR